MKNNDVHKLNLTHAYGLDLGTDRCM